MATLPRKLLNILKNQPNLKIAKRFSSAVSSKLVFTEHGDPIKVIHPETCPIEQPKPDEVLVEMLAAPVNPADINQIQGKYPVKPTLPAVGGNEGVARVIEVGGDVTDLCVGDHVVPLTQKIGTWQSHVNIPKNFLLKVPKELGLVEAATLTVNPCTAYRMLRDFVDLKPGDTVIQNGANSACGQNVIQICRAWGLRSVNIIRDRPEVGTLRTYLKNLGATHVLTEEELRKTDIFKSKEIERPKLALNCVGGKNALEILRHLEHGSTMVTYGGMSRDPVSIATSSLIFKDLRLRGFWMTAWSAQNSDNVDRFEMFEEIISMMLNNELQGPSYQLVPFKQFKEALMNTMTIKGMIGKKYILTWDIEE